MDINRAKKGFPIGTFETSGFQVHLWCWNPSINPTDCVVTSGKTDVAAPVALKLEVDKAAAARVHGCGNHSRKW